MKYTYTKNSIPADFFSAGHRVSCQVAVPVGGLNALLIDPLNSYLELEDAYISRINSPGEIVAHYSLAAIRKENILFLILARREDGDPAGVSTLFRPAARRAFLTVRSFELRGTVETEAQASPRDIMIRSVGRFIPLYEATATAALFPDTTFDGSLFLVNKDQVEAFCIDE